MRSLAFMKQAIFPVFFMLLSLISSAQEIDRYAIRDQYIVQLQSDVDAARFFASEAGLNIRKCLSKSMNIWLVQSNAADVLAKLNNSASVRVAQYNHNGVVHRALIPNDTLYNLQWNMPDISAPQAWQLNHRNVTQAGDSIVIAVIDGQGQDSGYGQPGVNIAGYDLNHPDLNFYINHHEIPNNGIDDDSNGYVDDYRGWSVYTDNDHVYNIGSPHSTHVSGIAGAIGNNHIGVAGVNWGAEIMPIIGAGSYESDVVNAYDYVVEMRKLYKQTSGAKGAYVVVTNSSFGVGNYGANPDSFPIWCAMYDTLGHYGVLSAVAVPDAAVNVDIVNDVPTGCPSKYMIAVTNTTQSDNLNGAAGYGITTVDLGAPGTSILSCYPDSQYHYLTGTSMSSPHLAGTVAALVANACPALLQAYAANPDSIALLMRDYIFQSVDPLNALTNKTTTGGRLNLYHALIAEDGYNCNSCNYTAALNQQNLNCYKDSNAAISVAVSTTNPPYHYLWSNGDTTATVTGLKAGYYMVTVTDAGGCQRQLSTLIAQPEPITLSSITVLAIDTPASVGNIIVNATSGNDSMYYAIDGGNYQTGAVFVTNTAGVHIIHVRNQSGCVYDTAVGIYYAGIEEVSAINTMSLAPNPVSDIALLTVSAAKDMKTDLQLNDMTGRVIIDKAIQLNNGAQQIPVDMSMVSQGVYLLTLSKDGDVLATMKVVK